MNNDNIPMIVSVLSVLFLIASCSDSAGSVRIGAFETTSPEDAGMSAERLDSIVDFCEESGSAALLILYDGKIVLAWGEVMKKYPVHSIRKAFLNSLYGIHIERGDIDLDMTLEELGIDDIHPVLTKEEKQAKIFDLVRSRSGVYHPAAAEAQVMIDTRPERGSQAPGSFFYYNNWDFNALCTIFEQETGSGIYEAFHREIAVPLGMRDFRVEDGRYMHEREKSLHPAYHFYMTAHDMALYGLLYMNNGTWNGRQIVPGDWIAESTRPHSVMNPEIGLSYGCLWYVLPADTGLGRMFFHTGAGVHLLAVCPDMKVVIVHRVDTLAENVRFTGNDLTVLFHMIAAALAGVK